MIPTEFNGVIHRDYIKRDEGSHNIVHRIRTDNRRQNPSIFRLFVHIFPLVDFPMAWNAMPVAATYDRLAFLRGMPMPWEVGKRAGCIAWGSEQVTQGKVRGGGGARPAFGGALGSWAARE
jgi:hypothetical protein